MGAPGAVQPPTQNRCKGKAAQGQGNWDADPIAVNIRKGTDGQPHAEVRAVRQSLRGCENDQSRHGAYHDGVQKHLHDAQHPLFRRVVHLGGSVGNGSGPHSGLVGEYPTGGPHPHGRDHGADEAAGDGFRGKSPLENEPECDGDTVRPDDQGPQAQQ